MAASKKRNRSEQRGSSKVVGKPFEKGRSGNPGGRPRIPDDVKEAAKALTSLAMATLEGVCRDADAPASARVTAAEAILNRAWGKPTQAMEVTGKDGGPVVLDGASELELSRRIAFLLTQATRIQPQAPEGT